MQRQTTLVLKITWENSEVVRPGLWDWVNIVDPGNGHVEIVADSDWQSSCTNVCGKEVSHDACG